MNGIKDILAVQIGSIMRNLLSLLAGALITHGVITTGSPEADAIGQLAEPFTQLAVGLAMGILAHWSSIVRNLKVLALRRAVRNGSPATVYARASDLTKVRRLYAVTGMLLAASLLTSCSEKDLTLGPDFFGVIDMITCMLLAVVGFIALCVLMGGSKCITLGLISSSLLLTSCGTVNGLIGGSNTDRAAKATARAPQAPSPLEIAIEKEKHRMLLEILNAGGAR